MKFFKYVCAIIFIAFCVMGCASTSQNAHYKKLAEEHPFEYFFPSSNFVYIFSTIDEAYEFINMADKKFAQTIHIHRTALKGNLAAKLFGPILNDTHVTVIGWINADKGFPKNEMINLSKITEPLETVLKQRTITYASLVFCVFYRNRAVSIPYYYLDSRYGCFSDGNAQLKNFIIKGISYETNYPVGWHIEKSFQYLRGEIN